MINLYFTYKNKTIKLPIPPENLEIVKAGNNQNEEVVGLGEINIIKFPRLKTFEVSAWFPEEEDPKEYEKFFDLVRDERKPVKFIATRLNYNMLVSVDAFTVDTRSGEEGDLYFTLEFQEWRDYTPQRVAIETNQGSIIVDRVSRNTEDKPVPPTDYTVKSGDNLWKISQKYTGDGSRWTELYSMNKGVIGGDPNLIYPNQNIVLPSDWK